MAQLHWRCRVAALAMGFVAGCQVPYLGPRETPACEPSPLLDKLEPITGENAARLAVVATLCDEDRDGLVNNTLLPRGDAVVATGRRRPVSLLRFDGTLHELDGGPYTSFGLAAGSGLLVAGSDSGEVYAWDEASLAYRWQTSGPLLGRMPVWGLGVQGDKVVAGGLDGC